MIEAIVRQRRAVTYNGTEAREVTHTVMSVAVVAMGTFGQGQAVSGRRAVLCACGGRCRGWLGSGGAISYYYIEVGRLLWAYALAASKRALGSMGNRLSRA